MTDDLICPLSARSNDPVHPDTLMNSGHTPFGHQPDRQKEVCPEARRLLHWRAGFRTVQCAAIFTMI
ncbi:hypothetical protein A0U92_00380 [Acetobacter aceti]|uniref:Uncharacterized protein n=1 Tax=Acetobacter aceti TaxID=435 RepID=A0A1U9KCG0_ACEAC|nr:hypothetical protein A0U92_00380 [Acetobacter aceti]